MPKKGAFKYKELSDEQWLYQRYEIEKSSSYQIAQMLGCPPPTVRNALIRHRLRIRSYAEAQRGKPSPNKGERGKSKYPLLNDKNWLYQQYWEEGASLPSIRRLIGCGLSIVLHSFKKFNIPRRSLSDALKGERNPMYGRKGENHPLFGVQKHQKFPTHHTKPELAFEAICKKNNLPFKYIGDGSFWIGGINPDFIHLTKKIVVEVFGWHHDELQRHCKVRYSQTYHGRKKILKKYGYKMIVFWQDDLDREDAEARVVSVLEKEGIIK